MGVGMAGLGYDRVFSLLDLAGYGREKGAGQMV
jgi:hypothetical protein